jgi:hypothetical protein
MKNERISYHVPGDLVPIIRELAERDGTPPSKWLGEIIRASVREQRQKLVTVTLLQLGEQDGNR